MSAQIDPINGLNDTLSKAQALAFMTWGESGAHFRNMSEDMQDVFLWTLSDLIAEANKHLGRLQDAPQRKKGGANGS